MIRRELVLVGAGAAHLVALRAFAMAPLAADTRLSLVVPEAEQPYSGLVPAVMAGRRTRREAMLDVAALARSAGARLILGKAAALDCDEHQLHLEGGRPALRFDWLSLCPGAAPAMVPGVAEHTLPLKPLGALLDGWEEALRPGLRVVVAGGGAAGVEAALAAATRLDGGATVTLLGEVLPGLGQAAAAQARRALNVAGIAIRPGRVARLERGRAMLEGGAALPFDLCLWAAGAAPPAWLSRSALTVDAQGWFLAEPSLRAVGHTRIFLAGDIAHVRGVGRPGHGVASVRQGLPLAHNLRAVLEGRPLVAFRPQRRYLALLQAGGAAIAVWGGLACRADWALRWKDRIDARWMESFRRLPLRPMRAMPPPEMRCDGCGAKLPPQVLAAVLARLGGLPDGAPDDAALLPPPAR